MQDMQQGGNAAISAACPTISFRWTGAEGRGVAADVSAYCLTAAGKVRGDHDMVFYNQPVGAGGALRFDPAGQGRFTVDLAALPDAVERIAFCITIDEAQSKGHTLALIDGAGVTLADGDVLLLGFTPELGDAAEAAMVLAELYRRAGQWKFRAVGQGFNGGLAPLARSFGIDVAEEPAAAAPPPPATPPRFQRVALEEADEAITLAPVEDGFGEIAVTLTWSQGRRNREGTGGAADLDLACLIELADGRKGAVQAIGAMHGTFDAPPFIHLSGDDRTGGSATGETLRINGDRWREIRRIAVFANVYDGVPDWQHAAPLLLVTAPAQPPIQMQVGAGRNDRRLCAIALLQNDDGQLTVTRKVDYFIDQRQLDEHFGWGLQWQAGNKK